MFALAPLLRCDQRDSARLITVIKSEELEDAKEDGHPSRPIGRVASTAIAMICSSKGESGKIDFSESS